MKLKKHFIFLALPCIQFSFESFDIVNPSVQTLSGHHVEFYLGYVKPTLIV